MRKNQQKLQLLFALIKGARRSDKELSKITGTTRSTVTRTRRALEIEGYINEYTILPEFTKIGYTLLAFTFLTLSTLEKDWREKQMEWFKNHNSILFAADGEGLATNIIMSAHKNYSDFSNFISGLRVDSQEFYDDIQFFVVDLVKKENTYLPFSLTRLDPDFTDDSNQTN
ncbi:MAG: winged helix-turn-helix transcriptional regulator [Candidatus Bathyarchaeota archaeon]|nr:winged helix-turn-helix transcriptional regulator [Candidatus Bathyarchaeum sp.]